MVSLHLHSETIAWPELDLKTNPKIKKRDLSFFGSEIKGKSKQRNKGNYADFQKSLKATSNKTKKKNLSFFK